jgi:hypothetical protein
VRPRFPQATSHRASIVAVGAAIVVAVGVAFALGGAGAEPGGAASSNERRHAEIGEWTSAEASKCPPAVRAGRFAPARITEAIRRDVPRIYAAMSAQGERNAWRDHAVVAVFSLDIEATHGAPAGWRPALLRYREAARIACGATVARRSWVSLLRFPRAANALAGEGVVFLARSRDGWRIWARTIASELPRLDLVPQPTSSERTVSVPNCRLRPARRTSRTVLVHLQKENYDRRRRFPGDPRIYVPVAKAVTEAEAQAPLRAALVRLLDGATKRERRLGCFSTFSQDAHVLRAVKIVDGRAVVDFHRRPFRDQLAIVSASHAGAVFLTQLELTIFQFPNVRSIRYEFDGDCAAFGWFMQVGECMVVRRSDRNRSAA